MKSIFFTLLLVTTTSLAAFADEASDHQDGPCKKIMDACKILDSAKGDHKQKMGIYKDCFQPLMNGQSVAGVSVEKADVSACNAKRQAQQTQQKKGK